MLDPETMQETPDAEFGADGRLLNADAATGELVNTSGAGAFAGYYNDPDAEAERMRGGMYWSGDLAYRDADGFVYFAGRTADWLRVDGENLAAAPVERILLRHPDISEAVVYAVPDERVGDQVMAALVVTGAPRAGAVRGVPGRAARPLPQGLATLRPDRRRAAQDRYQQGPQARARRRGPGGRRRRAVGAGAARPGLRSQRPSSFCTPLVSFTT